MGFLVQVVAQAQEELQTLAEALVGKGGLLVMMVEAPLVMRVVGVLELKVGVPLVMRVEVHLGKKVVEVLGQKVEGPLVMAAVPACLA